MIFGRNNDRDAASVPKDSPAPFVKVDPSVPRSWHAPGIGPDGSVELESGETMLYRVPCHKVGSRVMLQGEERSRQTLTGMDNRANGSGTTDFTWQSELILTTRRLIGLRNLGGGQWAVGHARWDWVWRIDSFTPGQISIALPLRSWDDVVRERTFEILLDSYQGDSLQLALTRTMLMYRAKLAAHFNLEDAVALDGLSRRSDADLLATGIRGIAAAPLGWHLREDAKTAYGEPSYLESGPWFDSIVDVSSDLAERSTTPRRSPVPLRGGSWMGFGPCEAGLPGDGLYPSVDESGRVASEPNDTPGLAAVRAVSISITHREGPRRWIHQADDYSGLATNCGHRLTLELDRQQLERVEFAPVDGLAAPSVVGGLTVDALGLGLKAGANALLRRAERKRNAGGPLLGHVRFDWVMALYVGVDDPLLVMYADDRVTAPSDLGYPVSLVLTCHEQVPGSTQAFGKGLAAWIASHRLRSAAEALTTEDWTSLSGIVTGSDEPPVVGLDISGRSTRFFRYRFPGYVPIASGNLWGRPLKEPEPNPPR